MAAEDDGKTEKPTPKKLDEAREKGDVAQSQEIRLWASIAGGFVMIVFLGPLIAGNVANAIAPILEHFATTPVDRIDDLQTLVLHLGLAVMKALAWPFAAVILVSLVALVGQTQGFLWVPSKLVPDFNRLNPIENIQRMVSLQQVVDLVKQLAKLGVVATVLYIIIKTEMGEYGNLPRISLGGVMRYARDKIFILFLTVLVVATLIAASDYLFQRWRFTEKMKMSKQDIRDEHKQSEGDPMVKGKLRNLRAKRARQRMMQAVPEADVVVTNPTHFAVALKYDMDTMPAPMLVAKGADLIAKRIRDVAEENEIPVVENPPLARALYATVELDQEIPPEHYKAVAEVIGYVMRLKGKLAR